MTQLNIFLLLMAGSSVTVILIGVIILGFILVASMIKVVPQRTAIIVERLGKYRATFTAGFQVLIPFIDKVRYRHTLKEQAIDVPPQVCITRDNIAVEVDGILYLQVLDPQKASYGIDNYRFASIQIAQTTMRSIIQSFSSVINTWLKIILRRQKNCLPGRKPLKMNGIILKS